MDITIVVPVYNEEKRLEPSLVKIIDYLKQNFEKYEVLVVDDGSKDNTCDIALKYVKDKVRLIKNDRNRGKGYTVKNGILNAKYPLVLFTDSDLSVPFYELGKMVKFVDNYDVVIASRGLKESDVRVKQPFYRSLMGKTFPLIVRLLVLRGIKDTQCGFKLFKTEAARRIVRLQTFDRWAFDVEILFIAKKMGYKIKEVPVIWIDSPDSRLNPIKDAYTMLRDLFRIRLNQIKGLYKF